MHLSELAIICSCLLLQTSARVAPRQISSAISTPAKLETSPLPAVVDTSDESITATSTATLNGVSSTTSTTSASAAPTGPRNYNVAVAQNGTQFTPSSLKNIPVGDTLTFYFYPSNYSIVQSTFAAPCQPLVRNGVYSGFHPTENLVGISREKFVMTVTNAETAWFYGVDGSILASGGMSVCEKGMSMVLNPLPKEQANGQTLGTYRRNSANSELNGTRNHTAPIAEGIWGGEVQGLSEKQKARWESKHPIGGNVSNNNGTGAASAPGGSSTSGVASFQNGGAAGKGNSLMAIAVLVGTSVFGLRF